MQSAAKRNFILQQGFADPAPAACPLQYSALLFQPRIVFVWLIAGILFRSPVAFAALCAVLWWSALFPKWGGFVIGYEKVRAQALANLGLVVPGLCTDCRRLAALMR